MKGFGPPGLWIINQQGQIYSRSCRSHDRAREVTARSPIGVGRLRRDAVLGQPLPASAGEVLRKPGTILCIEKIELLIPCGHGVQKNRMQR